MHIDIVGQEEVAVVMVVVAAVEVEAVVWVTMVIMRGLKIMIVLVKIF